MKSKCSFRTFSIWLVVAWLVIFAVIPQILVLGASFLSTSKEGFLTLPMTLEQYRQLVDPIILGIVGRSLGLAGMVTLVCLIVGYPFAWILARTPRNYRTFLLILLVIPFWTNSLIRTYALIAILNTRGLLNTLLLATGIIETPLRILYTQGAVLVGLTYTLLPFMVLPLYAAIEKLDPGLREAARDLGASRWATFVRVDLPLTQGGIIAGCMLVFLPALGMFYIPDILGGARSLLMGNFIRDQFMIARNWPFGSAASVFLTVIMTLLLGVYAWRRAATTRQGEGT
jgi:spermidine/putrescine transport system permease protein